MIKSEKKVRELSSILSQKNNILVLEAIGMLRKEEPFAGAIALLTSFYDNTEDRQIKETIAGFMNDIKDQSASSEIIVEIKKPFSQSTICMLVSSCWQSGLNYSEYSIDMVDIFLKSDFATALECFTVLEESVHKLSVKRKNELITIINSHPHSTDKVKEVLTRELISILA